VPLVFCALPLMLYDALWERKWWLTLPALVILTNTDDIRPLQVLIAAGGTAAAIIIFLRISKLEESVGSLTALRDEVTEKNLRLAQQNVLLAEAQDNEIHLATLRERNRIAREIHDNVGHMLTRSLLQSGALLIINKDEALREPLTSLRDTLDTAMTSIRQSVHDLHDDSVDLKKVATDCLSAVSEKFETRLEYDVSGDIPGRKKMCIAGVVRESISNAAKHSAGDRLAVVIREHPGFYQAMIEDNGPCTVINETGIGLKNMSDRARNEGGRITFTPSESGFRVFMTIPKE
jgi:signal transduction histidine kinase